MHFTFHSPHVTCHVTTLSHICDCDMWPMSHLLWLCDHDMTSFPCSTFIVVIQLNKRNKNRNDLAVLLSHDTQPQDWLGKEKSQNDLLSTPVKGYKRELHTGTNKTIMCQLPIVY